MCCEGSLDTGACGSQERVVPIGCVALGARGSRECRIYSDFDCLARIGVMGSWVSVLWE